MSTESCPDIKQWRAFLDGSVDEATSARLESHLEACEACPQTLERAAAGRETWEGTAEQLEQADRQRESLSSSGHLQDVLEKLKNEVEPEAGDWTVTPESLNFLQPSDEDGLLGRIGPYDVLEVIGHGGMGIVLKGWEPSLRRVVAIKVLASHLANSAAARKRFVREAQAAAAVTHDHVVAIHAVEATNDPPYLVMQFIEGKTLQQRLDISGSLDLKEVLRIGQQTAQGLDAAHRQGIVHRDIKPANILLENGVERVRITDFGLARAIDDASMTQSGVIAGTPLFMAPEQAQGQPVDHRSDLFSLGSVLYAMCTGRPPFRSGSMMGVIRRVCDEEARPIREINPDIPDWLSGIVDRLLSKDPNARYQSAAEVADLLGDCLAHVQHPLSIPLPNSAADLQQTFVAPEPLPTATNAVEQKDADAAATFVDESHRTSADSHDAEKIRTSARAALRWPARLMMLTAFLNAVFHLFLAMYFFAAGDNIPSGSAMSGFFFLIFFIAMTLTIYGAYRVSRLDSLPWGLAAAVLCLILGPAYPIGWPAGIWTLLVLGRADIRTAFGKSATQYAGLKDPAELASTGRTMARIVCIVGIIVAALLLPGLSVLTSQANVGVDVREAWFYGFAVIGLAIMGMGALFRYGFGVGDRQISEEQLTRWKTGIRSPSNWIGTFASIAALMIMGIDYSGPFYEPVIEAIVLPLAIGAMGTLLVIAFVRYRRNSNLSVLKDDPRYVAVNQFPVFFIAVLLPATLLWWQWSAQQGYVRLETDSPDALIEFEPTGAERHGSSGPWYGGVTIFRFPPGKYKWKVADKGLIPDAVAFGLVEVQPRTTEIIGAKLLGKEALKRIPGRWKCKEYSIDWASDAERPLAVKELNPEDERDSTGLPTWSRRPIWAEFTDKIATFHYADEPKKLEFLWKHNVNHSPKKISMTVRTGESSHNEDVAMGIWAASQNSLVLKLAPFGEENDLRFDRASSNSRSIRIEFGAPDEFVQWQGEWEFISAQHKGQPCEVSEVTGRKMLVDGEQLRISSTIDRGKDFPQSEHPLLSDRLFKITIDPGNKIVMTAQQGQAITLYGGYELKPHSTADGETQLQLSVSESGYPPELPTKTGSYAILKRLPMRSDFQ